MKKILIHTCCADCMTKMVEALQREFEYEKHQMLLFFFNPNIHPESEWTARMNALKQIAEYVDVELVIQNWQPKMYFERIKMLKTIELDVTQKNIRCPQCYELRLGAAAEYAAAHEIPAYTSTMLTSTYLFTDTVKVIGWQQAKIHDLNFVIPDKIDTCLHTTGFYKQNYCGCIYSLQDRLKEKYL